MLKFLGVGGAFTKENGNTSAYYYVDSKSILLIDVGESIFNEVLNRNLLDNIENICILITHFHSDHIGSLGSLLFYCDYLNLSTKIVFPNVEIMKTIINLFGLDSSIFNIIQPKDVKEFKVRELRQVHDQMEAYGYLLKLDGKTVYYSGDTKIIPTEILEHLNAIDYVYQDVRDSDYPHHLSVSELEQLIPFQYRDKINCMHYPDNTNLNKIKKLGFKYVRKEEIK
ncbi:MAG: MBL fold metallo-hydrolase [Bacilli bacterium]|nr:MBL fold metallo-hydrolase [Bacilli bacterium]